MKKTIIPIFLFLLIFMGVALAEIRVNLNPQGQNIANASWQQSSSLVLGFNITGNVSTYSTCNLYTEENGTFHQRLTTSNVVNNTNTNFSARTFLDTPSSTVFNWNVFCNSTTAEPQGTGNWSVQGNYTVSVDTVNPTITRLSYTSASNWDDDGNVSIFINVTDTNVADCALYTTLNATSNSSGTYNLQNATNITSYINGTALRFLPDIWHDTIRYKFLDNNTGAYYFNISCNDSSARRTETGLIYVFVDDTNPGDFDFNISAFMTNNRGLFNNTVATDFEPQVGWNVTEELNISRYEIFFYPDDWATYTNAIAVNVTNRTQLAVNMSTLAADTVYWINITAFDLAGNRKEANTVKWKYTTTSINRAFQAGW